MCLLTSTGRLSGDASSSASELLMRRFSLLILTGFGAIDGGAFLSQYAAESQQILPRGSERVQMLATSARGHVWQRGSQSFRGDARSTRND